MKKVLYIVSTLKSSGPTNQLSYIIKYIDRNQFTPSILTLSPEPEDSALEYFRESLNVRVESMNLSRIQGLLIGLSQVKRYILEKGIDIVHTQGMRTDGLVKNIDIAKVSTLRNYPYNDYPTKFGNLKGYLMAWSHMRSIRLNQDNCVACSKSISDDFFNAGVKLKCIQNGVDIEKYHPLSNEEKLKLRIKLGINPKCRIYIVVGSLIPRKNVATIINAFCVDGEQDSLLFVAGDGFERKELKSIAGNNVKFLGDVSNIAEYLQISDCFISASLSEGLPNTVLEAMSCNLPLLLSDIPPHKELCLENAFFFKVYDVDSLSKAISSFNIHDPGLSNLVTKNFSAHLMSTRYQKLYLERLC
jgi:glycosyltransferase involved in cell wall biosynthesis